MTEVQRIEGALYALANIRYGADTVKHRGHPEQKTRRTMSAAARKRIGDAQRKRWAKVKRK